MAVEEKKKRKSRPRPSQALAFTVWSVNGGPVPDDATRKIEEAIEKVTFELFNDGHRLLTQTTRA